MALSLSISIAINSVVTEGGGPPPPPANAIFTEDNIIMVSEDNIILITE